MTEPAPKANPFEWNGKWFWYDETGDRSKPYPSQRAALTDLLRYMKYLEEGPTLWQSIWWPLRYKLWPQVREFLRA